MKFHTAVVIAPTAFTAITTAIPVVVHESIPPSANYGVASRSDEVQVKRANDGSADVAKRGTGTVQPRYTQVSDLFPWLVISKTPAAISQVTG